MSERKVSRAELERAYGELTGAGAGMPPTFIGRRASEIPVRPVDWLWRGRIPLGTLTVLDGDPGLGKSTLTAAIAAAVTRGEPLPGDSAIPRGAVVFVSIEDDPGAVIIPRLQAAGAQIDLVVIPEPREGAIERTVMLPEDLVNVQELIEASAARLVIVDPIMAALSAEIDANRDQDVRRVLAELNRIAAKTEAAVVIVRHLNKSLGRQAIHRGGGSIGIIGAARSGLLLTKHPADRTGLLLTVSKANLGLKPPALGLRIESGWNGVGVIHWGEEAEISADDALAGHGAEPDETATELGQAEAWLREALKDGSLPAKQVMAEAEENGFSERTIRRAKDGIGAIAKRLGWRQDQYWRWYLDEQQLRDEGSAPGDGQPMGGVQNLGHLDISTSPDTVPQPLRSEGSEQVILGAYKEGDNEASPSPPLGQGHLASSGVEMSRWPSPVDTPSGGHLQMPRGNHPGPSEGSDHGSAADRVRLIVIPGTLPWPHADRTEPDPLRRLDLGIRLLHDARSGPDGRGQGPGGGGPEHGSRCPFPETSLPTGNEKPNTDPHDAAALAWFARAAQEGIAVSGNRRVQSERDLRLFGFHRELIDLESWPGPWCDHCTEEPVEHEGDHCDRCLTANPSAERGRR